MADQNNAPERIWLDERTFNGAVGFAHSKQHHPGTWTEYIRADRAAPTDNTAELKGYEEWAADVKRLTRELDVELHGDQAAKQASLCDLIGSVRDFRERHATDNTALVEALRELTKQGLKTWNLGAQTGPHWVHLGAAVSKAGRLLAALASREASPAAQEPVTDADLAAARAEIERLLGRLNEEMARYAEWRGRAEKAETERDAAMALLADAYGAGTGGSVIESRLADAERDMRQRAADAAKAVAQAATIQAGRHPLQSRSHDDWMERDYGATMAAKAILSLPLKHADREGVV